MPKRWRGFVGGGCVLSNPAAYLNSLLPDHARPEGREDESTSVP